MAPKIGNETVKNIRTLRRDIRTCTLRDAPSLNIPYTIVSSHHNAVVRVATTPMSNECHGVAALAGHRLSADDCAEGELRGAHKYKL